MQFILATPHGGGRFIGPFATKDEAVEYGDTEDVIGLGWAIYSMESPDEARK